MDIRQFLTPEVNRTGQWGDFLNVRRIRNAFVKDSPKGEKVEQPLLLRLDSEGNSDSMSSSETLDSMHSKAQMGSHRPQPQGKHCPLAMMMGKIMFVPKNSASGTPSQAGFLRPNGQPLTYGVPRTQPTNGALPYADNILQQGHQHYNWSKPEVAFGYPPQTKTCAMVPPPPFRGTSHSSPKISANEMENHANVQQQKTYASVLATPCRPSIDSGAGVRCNGWKNPSRRHDTPTRQPKRWKKYSHLQRPAARNRGCPQSGNGRQNVCASQPQTECALYVGWRLAKSRTGRTWPRRENRGMNSRTESNDKRSLPSEKLESGCVATLEALQTSEQLSANVNSATTAKYVNGVHSGCQVVSGECASGDQIPDTANVQGFPDALSSPRSICNAIKERLTNANLTIAFILGLGSSDQESSTESEDTESEWDSENGSEDDTIWASFVKDNQRWDIQTCQRLQPPVLNSGIELPFINSESSLVGITDAPKGRDEQGSSLQSESEFRNQKKQVRFPEDIKQLRTVHPLVVWAFAHRAARKGPWEQYASDRERLQKRIQEIEPVLAPVFSPELRTRIYRERFS